MKIFGADNIFGVDLKENNKLSQVVQDDVPEINVPMPASKAITQMPRIITPVQSYATSRLTGRGQFVCSEYNLAEVGRVEDTESFVRQAFGKKLGLMFKEGYDLIGRNPRHTKYIKIRLSQIARASGEPTVKLLRDIGSSLIKKSNAFLVKVRDVEASGGKVRNDPTTDKELKPVAAYFVAPAESMEASFSGNKIVKWRQNMPYGLIKEYLPQDIVHIYYDRKDGFLFGTPQVVPVLDDIRALRKIEENIELLIYQHLFPLFQFKVGTPDRPATLDENGDREVDILRREIQFMPSEGGIVTTERHEITSIGAEGRALDAKGYLDHFKKRVIAGLGISHVDLGDGDTTNRATSDNMSRNLIDSVKDFQQVLEFFINELLIPELLMESTFGDDILDDENRVWLKFKEIDIDSQIRREAHMADQFAKNMVTQDEARLRVGYEPIRVPTPDDMETMDDNELWLNFPEWHKTFWKLIDEPKTLIQATKQANTPAGEAAAAHPSTAITPDHNEAANQATNEQAMNLEKVKGDAKVAAAKALAKARPKPKAKDAFVSSRYDEVEKNIVSYIQSKGKLDHDWVAQLIRTSMSETVDYLVANQAIAFRTSYAQYGDVRSDKYMGSIAAARVVFKERAERYIDRLIRDTISSLRRNVSQFTDPKEIINLTRAVFDTLKYRTDFIEYVELKKAHTLGLALAMRDNGHRYLVIQGKGGACDKCKRAINSLDSHYMIMDDLPPFHANCDCRIVIDKGMHDHIHDHLEDEEDGMDYPWYCKRCAKKMRKVSTVAKYRCDHCGYTTPPGEAPSNSPVGTPPAPTDRADTGSELEAAMKADGRAADCEKCGKLALRAKDTPDVYNCRACRHSFRKE